MAELSSHPITSSSSGSAACCWRSLDGRNASSFVFSISPTDMYFSRFWNSSVSGCVRIGHSHSCPECGIKFWRRIEPRSMIYGPRPSRNRYLHPAQLWIPVIHGALSPSTAPMPPASGRGIYTIGYQIKRICPNSAIIEATHDSLVEHHVVANVVHLSRNPMLSFRF